MNAITKEIPRSASQRMVVTEPGIEADEIRLPRLSDRYLFDNAVACSRPDGRVKTLPTTLIHKAATGSKSRALHASLARASRFINAAIGHVCVTDFLSETSSARDALVSSRIPAALLWRLHNARSPRPPLFSFDPNGTHWLFWSIADESLGLDHVSLDGALVDALGWRFMRLRVETMSG